MEQAIGLPPFRFERVDDDTARIAEFERKSLVGHWRRVAEGAAGSSGRRRPAARDQRWVSCRTTVAPAGTVVELAASRGRGALSRALHLIRIISGGMSDPRTIYRTRHIPPGPVSLVASWAGMPHRLYLEPSFDAARGAEVFTATRVEAIAGGTGPFVKVRLSDGTQGYLERDQVVAAPEVATRAAQLEAARHV